MSTTTSPSSRPRIFVSSTIYDFRDLRSALKFWLQEFGYDVQMSDHADFGKPLDVNSYEACLRSIDSCTHFVLLIGSRVGGWYSKAEKVSITRAEYRHAYARFRSGALTLIPFVRRDVWDIREDRKALEDYLRTDFAASKELTDDEIAAITKHRSKFVGDADSIFSFIDEVARAEEMRAAIKEGKGYPVGNWIHLFDTFGDLATVLRQSIGITGSLRRRGLVANLKHEIAANLSHFLKKNKKTNCLELPTWGYIRGRIDKQMSREITGESEIDVPTMNHFALLALTENVRHLETTFLEEALNSGEFLDYDRMTDTLHVGPVQEMLIELRDAIRSYMSISKSVAEGTNLLATYGSRNAEGTARVKNVDLMSPIFMLDNNSQLSKRLVDVWRVLHTGSSAAPKSTAEEPPLMFDVPVTRKTSTTEATAWLHDTSRGDAARVP